MMRSLWIAKTGLDAQQTSLDTISNNLANVSTTAFKKVRPIFDDLLYQTLRVAGLDDEKGQPLNTGLQVGMGSRVAASQRINSQGTLAQSQNPLDVAVNGLGYLKVQTNNPTGNEPKVFGYTRAGNLMRDGDSYLVTASGDWVLDKSDNKIMIPQEASDIVIGIDGGIQYYSGRPDQNGTAGPIAVYTFANPSGLMSAAGGVYYETIASGSAVQGNPGSNGVGSISQYYTEQSNVNVAEELVGLIAAQRAYEITAKAVTASDQMLQKLGQM